MVITYSNLNSYNAYIFCNDIRVQAQSCFPMLVICNNYSIRLSMYFLLNRSDAIAWMSDP